MRLKRPELIEVTLRVGTWRIDYHSLVKEKMESVHNRLNIF